LTAPHMSILAFQMPEKVVMEKSDDFTGSFEFKPLEKGYGVRFKKISDAIEDKITVRISGQDSFTAGDIGKFAVGFQILNPKLVICNLDPAKELEFELTLSGNRPVAAEPIDEETLAMRKVLKTSLGEMDLSVRAYNCLKAADIKTLGELVQLDMADMMKFRNFGKKSLTELENLVEEKGLHFGMDLSKYRLDED
nr:alpha subunit of RNA polymerase, chloroplastic [Tanacetum cinerariifolium]